MEWTRVDVQSDSEMESIGSLADLKVGLDTDAESMHRGFLNELPHLSEVMEMHGSLVSDIESRALGDSVSTLGEFVSEFGGECCFFRFCHGLRAARDIAQRGFFER